MRAIRIHSYGGPDVVRLENIQPPGIGPHDVRIRVRAAGVNPVDWKIRNGMLKPVPLPMTLGMDLAGDIEETGDKVTRFEKDDAVYTSPRALQNGAFADFIVVPEDEVARKPASLNYVEAAAVPLAGLTAWQALFDLANLGGGQTVLIHGASGGVGEFAVQFAKWKGARVIGTASGRNERFVRELGADEFIDYKKQRFEEIANYVDVVLDTIGGDTQERSYAVLRRGGYLVSTVQPPAPATLERLGLRGGLVLRQPNGRQLEEIARLIDSGHVKPRVETVLPLAEAAQALRLSETHHARGKIVLDVSA